MGFDVFEIAVEDPAHFSGNRLGPALQENGLRPTICGAFGPSRDLTHEDPKFRRESLQYISDVLKLCRRWGVKLFAGPMYSAVGKRRQIPHASQSKTKASHRRNGGRRRDNLA